MFRIVFGLVRCGLAREEGPLGGGADGSNGYGASTRLSRREGVSRVRRWWEAGASAP